MLPPIEVGRLEVGSRFRTMLTAREGVVRTADEQGAWVEWGDETRKLLHPDVKVELLTA